MLPLYTSSGALCGIRDCGHVIRDCGEDIDVLQTPGHADLHVAADVKDTARIQGQWLIVHPGGPMRPRVPSNAIAYDSATAELPRDLGQTHIEVASQELNAMLSDFLASRSPNAANAAGHSNFMVR